MQDIHLSNAIEGYLLDRIASGYSERTIILYRCYLPILCKFLEDPPIKEIHAEDLTKFMGYLHTTYIPIRFNGSTERLSPSAVDNHWKAIRSFFKWCNEALGIPRPDKNLTRPKFKRPIITSFTEKEVKALIEACEYSKETAKPGQKAYRMHRPTAQRDRALCLFLLDTGVRIGELCRARIEDVNLENGEVLITPFSSGQKTNPRIVYLGKTARRALWIYLARREASPKERLFDLDERSIRSMLRNLGIRARVPNTRPHRFRHTFAINWLRNGGDVFSLKRLLGHHSLDMVEIYLDLAQADTENAHRKASPADNWKL